MPLETMKKTVGRADDEIDAARVFANFRNSRPTGVGPTEAEARDRARRSNNRDRMAGVVVEHKNRRRAERETPAGSLFRF